MELIVKINLLWNDISVIWRFPSTNIYTSTVLYMHWEIIEATILPISNDECAKGRGGCGLFAYLGRNRIFSFSFT